MYVYWWHAVKLGAVGLGRGIDPVADVREYRRDHRVSGQDLHGYRVPGGVDVERIVGLLGRYLEANACPALTARQGDGSVRFHALGGHRFEDIHDRLSEATHRLVLAAAPPVPPRRAAAAPAAAAAATEDRPTGEGLAVAPRWRWVAWASLGLAVSAVVLLVAHEADWSTAATDDDGRGLAAAAAPRAAPAVAPASASAPAPQPSPVAERSPSPPIPLTMLPPLPPDLPLPPLAPLTPSAPGRPAVAARPPPAPAITPPPPPRPVLPVPSGPCAVSRPQPGLQVYLVTCQSSWAVIGRTVDAPGAWTVSEGANSTEAVEYFLHSRYAR